MRLSVKNWRSLMTVLSSQVIAQLVVWPACHLFLCLLMMLDINMRHLLLWKLQVNFAACQDQTLPTARFLKFEEQSSARTEFALVPSGKVPKRQVGLVPGAEKRKSQTPNLVWKPRLGFCKSRSKRLGFLQISEIFTQNLISRTLKSPPPNLTWVPS